MKRSKPSVDAASVTAVPAAKKTFLRIGELLATNVPGRITGIEMDWTESGARVLSTIPIGCPACLVIVAPNLEHLCGDRLPHKYRRACVCPACMQTFQDRLKRRNEKPAGAGATAAAKKKRTVSR